MQLEELCTSTMYVFGVLSYQRKMYDGTSTFLQKTGPRKMYHKISVRNFRNIDVPESFFRILDAT